ncbi:MAG TPA: ATP-binding protein [Kofleriaceae bacterium]|nr:ATP-binding protein [Kofleriaceae bacterium]
MADHLAYPTQHELLTDALASVRERLRAAKAQLAARAADERVPPWPASLLERDAEIAARLARSAPHLVPIDQLRAHFELSATEVLVLWVLIAHELCPIARGLIRDLNSEHLADPTTDTLRRAVYGVELGDRGAWRELSDDSALRRFGLIECTDGTGDAPFHRQTWKVSDRVLGLAHGEVALDPRLAHLATISPVDTPLHHLELADGALAAIRAACNSDGIVIVHGRVGSGRRTSLVASLAAAGRRVLEIDAHALSKDRDVARRELRGLARECRLLSLVALIRDLDALIVTGDQPDRVGLVELELEGLVVATAARAIPRRWRREVIAIELEPITTARRVILWQRAIPSLGMDAAATLATMYPLAPALIHAAGRLAVRQCGAADIQPEDIAASLRSILDDRLAGLATRIDTKQTWDDVVLPDDQITALVELMARIRERATVYEEWGFAAKVGRGLGVSALFSGPPGTGKTMTAGLIAKELGVELYQVDISKIVSKWIGETEKNLAALFDAAEAGHAIILFDEADALFGKRTEIKSSNDRYANQEVNFLLQRLETYTGVVILTTNHETAIDDAFRRRLSLHVHFPMPERDERAKLWRALIPNAAPTAGELRLQKLADHFEMSGGYIRNAVVRAAFLAAAERSAITADHLTKAAHLEYEAMGKITSRI